MPVDRSLVSASPGCGRCRGHPARLQRCSRGAGGASARGPRASVGRSLLTMVPSLPTEEEAAVAPVFSPSYPGAATAQGPPRGRSRAGSPGHAEPGPPGAGRTSGATCASGLRPPETPVSKGQQRKRGRLRLCSEGAPRAGEAVYVPSPGRFLPSFLGVGLWRAPSLRGRGRALQAQEALRPNSRSRRGLRGRGRALK